MRNFVLDYQFFSSNKLFYFMILNANKHLETIPSIYDHIN